MDFETIEKKWQQRWFDVKLYEAKKKNGKKFFIHFAYPGISGYLHVGHMRGFTYADIIARYMRMNGYDVMFPAGFHATGLPAVSLAKKVERNDPATLSYLRTNGCPENIIKHLSDPKEVIAYFSKVYVEDYWKRFGFLIDYTRLITTVSSGYQKFIQWQFRKLKEKNLLIQKPHFAPFCTNCGPVAVDKSETDISQGGDAEILEFIVLKFSCEGRILPAATLRPETIFGVTNMWVNPDTNYCIARVNDEEWILSEEAVEKLRYQLDAIEVIGHIKGSDIVNKHCTTPLTGREIPILPASFADPSVATGVVMSVPAHAPYDYVALRDIGMPVEPITIIAVEGYDVPAQDVVDAMNIATQHDVTKLEEATQTVYKEEFNRGKMNAACGPYAGMDVHEAKQSVKERLFENAAAVLMREFSKLVVCRCGGDVIIKKIPDQWFIKYSDPSLTKSSTEWVGHMNIYPADYAGELPKILDWFDDRACIRQGSWLGTPFPFDKAWVIEPISDSTLYPVYYITARYVNEGRIEPNEMNETFFDYVVLGKGIAQRPLWDEIRNDISYWYPVDINLGGKEHKTVHFPVFIMNHVAVMPRQYWPRGIFVNWWITQKTGAKISKSKGGAEPIPDAAHEYGVDALRLYYSHVGSPFVDIEWDGETVEQYKKRLLKLINMHAEFGGSSNDEGSIDVWLHASFNEKLHGVREAMTSFELRKAANLLFYECPAIFNWYARRGGSNKQLIRHTMQKWVTAITPFTPHVAEELWERSGNQGFISLEDYPIPEEYDTYILKAEEVVMKTIEDIQEIKKVTKLEPSTIYIYLMPQWKRDIVEKANHLSNMGNLSMKTLMQELKNMTVDMKQTSQFAGKLIREMQKERFMYADMAAYFKEAQSFMESELDARIQIFENEDCYDPANKMRFAMPHKPAIYME
jgi:leucyl-tRNA synthetase